MRDMTRKQFNDALARHGFKQDVLPVYFKDTTGVCPSVCIGATLNLQTHKIDRRATIASLIQYREKRAKAVQ